MSRTGTESPWKNNGGNRAGSGQPVKHPEGRTVPLAITVPAALVEKIDRLAKTAKVSRSAAVAELIRKHRGRL